MGARPIPAPLSPRVTAQLLVLLLILLTCPTARGDLRVDVRRFADCSATILYTLSPLNLNNSTTGDDDIPVQLVQIPKLSFQSIRVVGANVTDTTTQATSTIPNSTIKNIPTNDSKMTTIQVPVSSSTSSSSLILQLLVNVTNFAMYTTSTPFHDPAIPSVLNVMRFRAGFDYSGNFTLVFRSFNVNTSFLVLQPSQRNSLGSDDNTNIFYNKPKGVITGNEVYAFEVGSKPLCPQPLGFFHGGAPLWTIITFVLVSVLAVVIFPMVALDSFHCMNCFTKSQKARDRDRDRERQRAAERAALVSPFHPAQQQHQQQEPSITNI